MFDGNDECRASRLLPQLSIEARVPKRARRTQLDGVRDHIGFGRVHVDPRAPTDVEDPRRSHQAPAGVDAPSRIPVHRDAVGRVRPLGACHDRRLPGKRAEEHHDTAQAPVRGHFGEVHPLEERATVRREDRPGIAEEAVVLV